MKSGVKVGDAMTRNIIAVSPQDNVLVCTKKLLDGEVGSVIVKDKEELKGIVTEKDILENVLMKKLDPTKVGVKDIMTDIVETIDPGRDIIDAIKIMGDKGFRRLPVVKDKKLVGLLTIKDVLKIQPDLFELTIEKMKIKEESDKLRRIY